MEFPLGCENERHHELMQLAHSMHKFYDEHAASKGSTAVGSAGNNLEIDCRGAGCAHCCSLHVTATGTEVLLIVGYIRALPEATQAALAVAVREAVPKAKGKGLAARTRKRAQCPLLIAGNCSVYPVRPVTCRSHLSFDATACEKDMLNPGAEVLVPQSGSLKELRSDLFQQLGNNEASQGIVPGSYELIQALGIVLDTPDATARIIGGEEVFRPAVARP